MNGVFKHKSRKNGQTYYLNSRERFGQEYFYFSREPRENPVDELPEGFMVVEAKNGVPMLQRSDSGLINREQYRRRGLRASA